MSYLKYKLQLDIAEEATNRALSTISLLDKELKAVEVDLIKFKTLLEDLKESLVFCKNRAKIVDLQAFVNTKKRLDETLEKIDTLEIEKLNLKAKRDEVQGMSILLTKKFESIQELGKAFGKKVLYHDFRRDSRINPKR